MPSLHGYTPLLDYRYWLNLRPVPLGPSLVGAIFIFFSWFIVAAATLLVAARVLSKKDALKAGILKRFSAMLFTAGGLGLLALFFSYEQLPLLGMRLWFLAPFIVLICWLGRIVSYIVRDYPRLKLALAERRRREKYLRGK